MRIGVFGGTFDPIHAGHLLLAEVALSDCGLDRVLFVPSASPPHKPEHALSPIEDRVNMVRLAAAGHPRFGIAEMEMRRSGPSYTVDTLIALEASFEWKSSEFFLILGSDMLLDLPNWKDPDEIVRRAGLLVLERSGFDGRAAEPRFLSRSVFVNAPRIGISSTEIRDRVRLGKSIRYWVPEAVERFIFERGLYRT